MGTARGLATGQVVEVLVPGTAVGYGSGYYLGGGLVLTARHVVERTGRPLVRFGTRAVGDPVPASVAWHGTGQVDLAFLRLEQADVAGEGDAAPEWGYLALGNPASGPVPFTAVGFPRSRSGSLTDGHPFRDTLSVTGTVRLGGYHKSGQLDLVVTSTELSSQLDWKGMSGAAVFVHDFLVGVVVRAASDGNRLIAIPVSAALGGQPVRLAEFTAGSDEQRGARTLLDRRGLSTRVSPAYRRPYLGTVLELNARTPDLRGREPELARLRAWLRSAVPYAVWSGIPWSGKTALAARLAADPPPDTDVVSFFVSSARGAQAERLWQVVADQLAAMVHEPAPADGDRDFDQLWRRASQASHDARRNLLLLIDGIDDLEERSAVRRLLERLPYRPLPGTYVLLLTRPNPRLDQVVTADHPLRGSQSDYIALDPSPDALQLRDRARTDLAAVLDGGGIALRALLLMARAGPMSEQDIRRAIGWTDAAADQGTLRRALTGGPSGRLLRQESVRHGQPRFVIGHDALREELTERADPQGAEADLRRLLALADDYAARGWPADTPDFLLEGYPSLLARRGDTDRLTATLLSPHWLDLARTRTHTVLTTATMLREALATMAADPAVSLADLLLLSAHIAELQPPRGDRHLPLITAWALAGQPVYAEYLTTDVADDAERAKMLAGLADQALEARDRDRAIRLADRALESARGLSPGSDTAAKASLLIRLQRLAQRLGRVASAAAAAADLWELLPLLPAEQHEQLWLDAAENAAADGDAERVRASAAILSGPSASPAARRRLAAAAQTAGDTELAARLLASVRDADPADGRQVAAPAQADDPPSDRSAREAHLASRPKLAQVHALVEQGRYADAAARIDQYEDEPSILLDVVRNAGVAAVSFLAVEAARQGGAAAVPVVAAAQRFAHRENIGARLTWATHVGSGASGANSLMGEPAGTFLAEITQVAAEHGQLDELLNRAGVSADPVGRVQDFTALALGAARGGCADTADRLLSAVRADASGHEYGACYEIALCWAGTERWREAIDLVRDYKSSFEPYLVRANAVLTAIRMGDLPGADGVLRECLRVPSRAYDPEQLIAAAAVAAAEEGHWELALSLSANVESSGRLADLLANLAIVAHRAADPESAEAFLQDACETAELTEPTERVQALAACAAAALELGQATRARETLVRGAQALTDSAPEEAVDGLLMLAWRARQAGDADRCLHLLHRATDAARLAQEPHAKAALLSTVAAAAFEASASDLAVTLVAELAELAASPSLLTQRFVADLVVTAAATGDTASATTLLRAIADAVPAPSLHGVIDPEPAHLSMVAATAARAGLWLMAEEALAALPPDNRIDALAELAQLACHDAPGRARAWISQGLLLGPTPRLLAATARLEPKAAVAAASILLIRSHALSPPGGHERGQFVFGGGGGQGFLATPPTNP